MDTKIYTKELKKALLKVSNNKLKPKIAQKVAEQYVDSILNYTDNKLMSKGVTSIAKDLLPHIKNEHFKN